MTEITVQARARYGWNLVGAGGVIAVAAFGSLWLDIFTQDEAGGLVGQLSPAVRIGAGACGALFGSWVVLAVMAWKLRCRLAGWGLRLGEHGLEYLRPVAPWRFVVPWERLCGVELQDVPSQARLILGEEWVVLYLAGGRRRPVLDCFDSPPRVVADLVLQGVTEAKRSG